MGDFVKCLKKLIILQYFFLTHQPTIVVTQTTKFEILLLYLRLRLCTFITNNHHSFSKSYLLPNYIKRMCLSFYIFAF